MRAISYAILLGTFLSPAAGRVAAAQAAGRNPPKTSQELADEADSLILQKRYAEAKPLAKQACDAGIIGACYKLGGLFEHGNGLTQDYARARSLYQKACDGGIVNSCSNLASLYMLGRGVARNYAHARSLYQKACDGGEQAACQAVCNSGNKAECQRLCDGGSLEACYVITGSVRQRHYWKLCDSGDPEACDHLCGDGFQEVCALPGNNPKTSLPAPSAQTGAQAGQSSSKPQPVADTGNVDLADLGAKAGAGDVNAQVELGARYAVGNGTTKNYAQALSWLQKAAAHGNPEAEYDLGMMYYQGLGVKKNYALAASNFQKAAAHNYPGASKSLRQVQAVQLHGSSAAQPLHPPAIRKTGAQPVTAAQQTYVAFSFSSPGLHDFGGDGGWGVALDRNEQASIDQAVNHCAANSQRNDWCETDGRWPVCRADGKPEWVALALNNDGTAENWADGEAIGYDSESDAERAALSNCGLASCHVVWNAQVKCGAETSNARADCIAIAYGWIGTTMDNARAIFAIRKDPSDVSRAASDASQQLINQGVNNVGFRIWQIGQGCGPNFAHGAVVSVPVTGGEFTANLSDSKDKSERAAVLQCQASIIADKDKCNIVKSW